MSVASHASAESCRSALARFFAGHPDPTLQARVLKALRFLSASAEPLLGKAEGRAAGLVYAMANRDRFPCGIPALLNADFAAWFGVAMETIRRRAAEIDRRLEI
jgi:hypothetical protein